jgi:hypothetical protein
VWRRCYANPEQIQQAVEDLPGRISPQASETTVIESAQSSGKIRMSDYNKRVLYSEYPK